MKLYFNPLSCSLASRISIYEAGLEATFVEVDPHTKRLPDGADYRQINPLGLVPALETDDGRLLTENAAVLQHIGGRPSPVEAPEELQRWLSFIGTELHKGLFAALFDPGAPEAAKAYALDKGASRLAHVDRHLEGRAHLLDAFSVADAYLYTVLNWTLVTPIELADYPNLKAFHARIAERPHVARAFAEEMPLYRAEQARARAR